MDPLVKKILRNSDLTLMSNIYIKAKLHLICHQGKLDDNMTGRHHIEGILGVKRSYELAMSRAGINSIQSALGVSAEYLANIGRSREVFSH